MPRPIFAFITRMVNTQKAKDISMPDLQTLVKKYVRGVSGSKKEIAVRLWKLRQHMMSLTELKMIEDYLKIPQLKRYKGSRYRTRKNKYRQVPKC